MEQLLDNAPDAILIAVKETYVTLDLQGFRSGSMNAMLLSER